MPSCPVSFDGRCGGWVAWNAVAEGPDAGEYDEQRLRSELGRLLADSRARGWDAASLDALQGDLVSSGQHPSEIVYGNVAALLLMWITSNRSDAEAFEAAEALLDSDDDPRREEVLDLIHRVAMGEVTWTEFARITKKGLIRREHPEPPQPSEHAIPLGEALLALRTMLAEAGVDVERPDPRKAWGTFTRFAALPVTAAPLSVKNDTCLFQWGAHDWGEGVNFECDFTRQFVLHDGDDDYDHMEQLSLTLLFNTDDPDLASLRSGGLWSEGDLRRWAQEVEGLAVFRGVDAKSPTGLRLEHSEV
jgi:hypothetical protein